MLLLKKGNIDIIKNYKGVTLTVIAAKVYNTMILNHIHPEVKKIIRKKWNGLQCN